MAQTDAHIGGPGAWATFREALRGSPIDYTTAPVGRAVVMLAVPMVMEMAMESIFAVVDVFWVAHLGADAVATVGLTESRLTLIYTAAMGLSIGATALVARRMGEHDSAGAARAAGQSIVLGVIAAGLIGAIFAPRASALLRVMGGSPGLVESGSGFTTVMLGGNVTVVLLFLLNAIFRGSGDAAIAMRVLLLGNALNIVLGPCFIFGPGPFPELGVTGAALATNIGRGTAVCYQLVTLARGRGRLKIRLHDLRLDISIMRTVLRLSGSGTIQILVGTASYIGLVRILSVFGSSALAGYTIGIRIIVFALLPAFGISNAAATMVGQNLGAGRPDRAERAVWTAAVYNMVFLGAVGLIFLLFAAHHRPLHRRPAGAAVCDRLFAHREPRFRVLRVRDGGDLRVQRRRGYLDPHDHQPVRLLAVGGSARVVALVTREPWPARRLHCAGRRVLDSRRRERGAVQTGAMEDQEGVTS
jgi:putative MATE family efflux protein